MTKTVMEQAIQAAHETFDYRDNIHTSQVEKALRAALQVFNAYTLPDRYVWEERRGDTNFWDEMYDDEEPTPHSLIRNVRPLYFNPYFLTLVKDSLALKPMINIIGMRPSEILALKNSEPSDELKQKILNAVTHLVSHEPRDESIYFAGSDLGRAHVFRIVSRNEMLIALTTETANVKAVADFLEGLAFQLDPY